MRARKDKKYILPSLIGRGWGVGLHVVGLLLLLLLLLTACHDDDGPDMIGPEAAAWTVDVLGGGAVETDDEGNVYFERTATFGSLRLKIQGYDAQRDSTVKVALTDGGEWLTLETDTLGTEGILSLATTDNNGDSQRTATLVFTAANGEPPLSATLTVRQHSRADADSNGGNAKEDLYVGYGYDIFPRPLSSTSRSCVPPAVPPPTALRRRRPMSLTSKWACSSAMPLPAPSAASSTTTRPCPSTTSTANCRAPPMASTSLSTTKTNTVPSTQARWTTSSQSKQNTTSL